MVFEAIVKDSNRSVFMFCFFLLLLCGRTLLTSLRYGIMKLQPFA